MNSRLKANNILGFDLKKSFFITAVRLSPSRVSKPNNEHISRNEIGFIKADKIHSKNESSNIP